MAICQMRWVRGALINQKTSERVTSQLVNQILPEPVVSNLSADFLPPPNGELTWGLHEVVKDLLFDLASRKLA